MAEHVRNYYYGRTGDEGDAPGFYESKRKAVPSEEVLTIYKWTAKGFENVGSYLPTEIQHSRQNDEQEAIELEQTPIGQIESGTELDDNPDESYTEAHSDEIISESDEESSRGNDTNSVLLTETRPQTLEHQLPESKEDTDTGGLRIDDDFLNYIQTFTQYCEQKEELVFDDSCFLDGTFFPYSTILTNYIPMNIVTPKVVLLELQAPGLNEKCKSWCSSGLFEYFDDPDSFRNRESILRSNLEFVLSSIYCPKLKEFFLENISNCKITKDHPVDRMMEWNESMSTFISKHEKTLRKINIKVTRTKTLVTKPSNVNSRVNGRPQVKTSFPKLEELSITLWDSARISSGIGQLFSGDEWIPDWFPDTVDQYWISLMTSQTHGNLRKLVWISAANLNWNKIFQPLITANRDSLQILQVVETKQSDFDSEGLEGGRKSGGDNSGPNASVSISTSTKTLSCVALKNLKNLKELSLRLADCFLVDLKHLPVTLEKLTLDDVKIKSDEFLSLKNLKNLKVLWLAEYHEVEQKEFFNGAQGEISRVGVSFSALKSLLTLRCLDEFCLWGHSLNLKEEPDPGMVQSVFGRVNSFIKATIYKSSEVRPVPDLESKRFKKMQLLKVLRKIAIVDEQCIVISKTHF